MGILKDIIKNGAVMFAVGVTLALIAIPLAQTINALTGLDFTEAASHHKPLWTGAFFGSFGALHAAFAPVANRLFGDGEKPATQAQTEEKSSAIVIPQPEHEHAANASKHASTLLQERATSPGHHARGA